MFSLQGKGSIRREVNGHLIWRKESSTLWTLDALCPEEDEVHRLMFEVPVVIRVTAKLASCLCKHTTKEVNPQSPDHAQYYCDHDHETRDARPGKQISDACINGAYVCKRNLRDHDPGPR
jgi:hypothetical protein